MKKSVTPVITVAFLVRLMLLIINTYFINLPESGKDDKRFEGLAWDWTITGTVPADAFTESGAGTFIKCGAAIYSAFGRVPFFWAFILVCMGTWAVYNIYKATYLLWSDKEQAIRAGWLAAFFPEFAMLSSVLLREVVMHFFLSLAVISLIKFWKYKNKFSIITFLLYIGVCTLFHSAMIVALAGFGLAIVLISQDGKKKSVFYKLSAIILVAGGLIFINYTGIGLSKFGGSLTGAYDKFQSSENKDALGSAAYPDWMRITSLTDMWKIPVRVIAFLFSPAIPFMVKTVSHLAGVLDAMFYFYMFFAYYKNRGVIKKNKTAYVLFIISMAYAFVFSLGVSNFGTAIRHRSKILPLFLVLAIDFKALKRKQILKKKRMQALNEKKLQIQSSK